MFQDQRIFKPGSQMLMFIIIWLISAIAFTGLSLLLGMIFFDHEVLTAGTQPPFGQEQIRWLRLLQGLNQFGLLIFPVLLFGVLVAGWNGMPRQVWPGLRLKGSYLLYSIALLLLFMPLINLLIEWNEGISLPAWLQGMETWMRAREAAAKGISDAFLQGSGYPDLVWSLLIVAVLPSLGEELLFRGTLQPLFSRWTGSKHAGVWLSAILFSAIHMQFFGFVPRLLLGVIFGYALLRSGSLWLPVLLHFWNNGTIVVVTWLNARGLIHLDEAELSVFHPLWAIILGGALGLWLLFFMKETAHKPLESSSKLDIS
ncbi:MAG TPA: CPBP family intramembrane metalloprotease [Bacteroidales bacterium]|nr:CPBP family intramembrane metalloprotease [Bacteroidales bacterium]